jgi:hypothetical protein
VHPSEQLRYLAFVIVWIALPGVLLHQTLLRPERIGLADACIGLPLGYAQLVFGFVLLSALGLGGVAPYFPLASAATRLGLYRPRFGPPAHEIGWGPHSWAAMSARRSRSSPSGRSR